MLKFRENFFSCEELREIRKKFKYVEKDIHGNKRLFFDNAGGSLRLIRASDRFKEIDEIPDASEHTNKVALELLDIENQGRANMRMFFNAKRGTIATGYTASQLMMEAVRIISGYVEGTNCVTTILEHPSSFDAMKMYAEKYGRELRIAKANKETGGIDPSSILSLIDRDTAILSVMSASNISGYIMDINTIFTEARKINPNIIIISDAVQHAPHGFLDPEKFDIDVMNIAPYKFFGIRGFSIMYLSDRVSTLTHHRLLGKASDDWEIGSPGTGHFAAFSEIMDYVCFLGKKKNQDETDRRKLFEAGMTRIANHERAILELMLEGNDSTEGLRYIKGIKVKMDDKDLMHRDLIIGIEFLNMDCKSARDELDKRGVIAFERATDSIYSKRMVEQFDSEGMVRISPLHVNTPEEIEQFLQIVKEISLL